MLVSKADDRMETPFVSERLTGASFFVWYFCGVGATCGKFGILWRGIIRGCFMERGIVQTSGHVILYVKLYLFHIPVHLPGFVFLVPKFKAGPNSPGCPNNIL